MKLEVIKREIEIQQLQLEVTERTKSLKILYAMIRSPRMCNLLYKAERKRYTEEHIIKLNESSIHTLRQYRFEESKADQFVDNVYSTLVGQVADEKFSTNQQ